MLLLVRLFTVRWPETKKPPNYRQLLDGSPTGRAVTEGDAKASPFFYFIMCALFVPTDFQRGGGDGENEQAEAKQQQLAPAAGLIEITTGLNT